MTKIVYEPHPVSPDRKAELRAQGLTIIDERFKPVDDARAELDAALDGLPGDQNNQDYVVGAMRSHFGDLFTADDEAKVRELVPVLVQPPLIPQEPEKAEPTPVLVQDAKPADEPAADLETQTDAKADKPARARPPKSAE